MAALLYLPRLMVYHAESTVGSDKSETFKVMERRLLRGIATPAMIASWVFGLWSAWSVGVWGDGWFHAKLACVLALSAYHGMLARYVRAFADDRNQRPARFFRLINEVPTLLMIAIVIFVIVKPF
jgi:putative membrane protein